jgi:hypothetical protein
MCVCVDRTSLSYLFIQKIKGRLFSLLLKSKHFYFFAGADADFCAGTALASLFFSTFFTSFLAGAEAGFAGADAEVAAKAVEANASAAIVISDFMFFLCCVNIIEQYILLCKQNWRCRYALPVFLIILFPNPFVGFGALVFVEGRSFFNGNALADSFAC